MKIFVEKFHFSVEGAEDEDVEGEGDSGDEPDVEVGDGDENADDRACFIAGTGKWGQEGFLKLDSGIQEEP